MKNERRRSTRFEIHQMVEMSLGRERFISASAVNLSSAGMLCNTDEPIDTYSKVYLMFTINGKKPPRDISCEGVVVRSQSTEKGFQTAVEFSNIGEDDKKAIDAHNA